MSDPQTIRIGKVEYVIVLKSEYMRLRDSAGVPRGSVDAVEYTMQSIGADLRAARERASLTQAELAKKLKVSQPMVSGAESGTVHVGERYVRNVLKACGLPLDWNASRSSKPRKRARKVA